MELVFIPHSLVSVPKSYTALPTASIFTLHSCQYILMKWNSSKDNMKQLTVITGFSYTNACSLNNYVSNRHIISFQVIPPKSQHNEILGRN